ncbi:transcriptional regulator [Bacillus cereus]|uniref:transcriptional regulator n=1 Tax=Bacillus cereus TaxID=1396 RepID=UPI00398089FF
MEKNFWIVIAVLLSFLFLIFMIKELESLYITESFIKKHMMNQNGTIATYRLRTQQTEPDYALGRESLSESSGLWLEYLWREKKLDEWREHVAVVKREFVTTDNLLIWKLAEDGSEIATTNALIDDLRFIEVLFEAGEDIEFAKKVSQAVLKYNRNKFFFVDFFDNSSRTKANSLTISYINPRALQFMMKQGVFSESEWNRVVKFLTDLPRKNWAYPKTYIEKANIETYQYDKEVNLIDQSYIAYHKSLIGLRSPAYMEFIKKEFAASNKLFGRYSLETSKPLVTYESPALYGLTILYCIEENEYELGKQLYERMIAFRDNDKNSQYYGGYVTLANNDTHIFDNLFPLLAEQALSQKGIIK